MEIRKAYIENKRIYTTSVAMIQKAKEIADKVESLLPESWEISFVNGMWRGLLICNRGYGKKRPATDFKLVCKIVEKVVKKEVKKDPWTEGDKLFCLHGEVYVKIAENVNLKVDIRHFDPEGCHIDYEEKTVTIAKVNDSCLGLGGE